MEKIPAVFMHLWMVAKGYTADLQVALISSCSAVQPRDTCVFFHDICWGCLWEQMSLTEFDIQQFHKIVISVILYTSFPQEDPEDPMEEIRCMKKQWICFFLAQNSCCS